MDKRALTQRR